MLRSVVVFVLTVITLVGSFSLDRRIVGGEGIQIKRTPYQVSLQDSGEHWCGGSLIGEDLVLTAAHCFDDAEIEKLEVRVGSTSSDKGGKLVKVKNYICHEDFDTDFITYDIALLRLSEKVRLTDAVKVIQLATEEASPGTVAFISGWGRTAETNSTLPTKLRGVEVALISREECSKRYPNDKIFDYNICAFTKGKDSCQSDSGGPMVINNKLVGVVSWGLGCARDMNPGVYTSVPKVMDWIETTSKKV